MISKCDVYQNGFYLLVGAILGFILSCFVVRRGSNELLIRTEVRRDTVVAMRPVLSRESLYRELLRHGIPHSDIVMRQARLESGMGSSAVYARTNNLFGLRRGGEYRSYAHWTDCVKDYKRLVSSRYDGGDYYVFLRRIGYAEDPLYIEKLRSI